MGFQRWLRIHEQSIYNLNKQTESGTCHWWNRTKLQSQLIYLDKPFDELDLLFCYLSCVFVIPVICLTVFCSPSAPTGGCLPSSFMITLTPRCHRSIWQSQKPGGCVNITRSVSDADTVKNIASSKEPPLDEALIQNLFISSSRLQRRTHSPRRQSWLLQWGRYLGHLDQREASSRFRYTKWPHSVLTWPTGSRPLWPRYFMNTFTAARSSWTLINRKREETTFSFLSIEGRWSNFR